MREYTSPSRRLLVGFLAGIAIGVGLDKHPRGAFGADPSVSGLPQWYGDQGMFVRADVFRALGGFRDLRLMEDLDLSQRLKRVGRTVLVRVPLVTSGRRFLARGPWRTFAFIVWLLLLRTLRVDTERYAERWRGPAERPPGSAWPRAAS